MTAKTPGLSSPLKLFTSAWAGYRARLKTYVLVTGVVLVPVSLLGLSSSLAADSSFSAYISIISVLMNLALIYTIVRINRGEDAPSIREAYYEGTASFVRFILVSAVLALVLVPAAVGVTIYIAATAATSGTPISIGEALLMAAVGLIIAIPSMWLLARFIFSYYALITYNLRPMAALKLSRNLTIGRFWRVFGRVLALGVMVLVGAVLLALPPILLALVYHNGQVLTTIFQMLFGLVALPMANLYLVRLFGELEKVPVD